MRKTFAILAIACCSMIAPAHADYVHDLQQMIRETNFRDHRPENFVWIRDFLHKQADLDCFRGSQSACNVRPEFEKFYLYAEKNKWHYVRKLCDQKLTELVQEMLPVASQMAGKKMDIIVSDTDPRRAIATYRASDRKTNDRGIIKYSRDDFCEQEVITDT